MSDKTDDTTDGTVRTNGATNIAVRIGRQSVNAILAIQSLVSRESHCVYVLVCGLITGISTFARVASSVARIRYEISYIQFVRILG